MLTRRYKNEDYIWRKEEESKMFEISRDVAQDFPQVYGKNGIKEEVSRSLSTDFFGLKTTLVRQIQMIRESQGYPNLIGHLSDVYIIWKDCVYLDRSAKENVNKSLK